MAEQEDVLEIERLTRRYGSRDVLSELRLRVKAGHRLGVSGPNGSGKTTLLRCIAGSLAPTSGTVTVVGSPAGSIAARAATGFTAAHDRAFYVRLSGRDNLSFYASLRLGRSAARAAVRSLVDELELDFVDVRVDRYSSGMLQQLAVARALLGEPRLLLLDEPTSSLDDGATQRLWGALARRPQTAVVLVSHRREDLEKCDERLRLS